MKKSQTAKLTIVTLNYNTEHLVVSLLRSIRSSKHIDFGIKTIVVDNASSSLKKLEKINWIKLIKSPNNIGFSAGNNLAIPYLEGDYTWFLNPDTELAPDTISFMVKYLDAHPDVAIATPKLILKNGKFDRNCHRAFPTPWNALCHFAGLDKIFPKSKLFSGYYLGHLDPDSPAQVDVVGGSSFLVRKNVGSKVGWWDEDFFMYGEDIAFPYLVKQLGYKVMYLPQAIVFHHHGASSGIKRSSSGVSHATFATKLRSLHETTRAMEIFYRKYYLSKYPRLLTFLVILAIKSIRLLRVITLRLQHDPA